MGPGMMSALVQLDRELWEPPRHGAVERSGVLLRGRLVERRGEPVPHRGQLLAPGRGEVEVVGVALLGLFAACVVVRALGRLALGDQARVLALEEGELALDRVGEAA